LRTIGLEPITRLKTSGTIVDKLRRQPAIDLKHVHDLAGARIVQPTTLDKQDEVASMITEAFPGSELLDRREIPSFGYRAIHVISRVERCPVEIQLRTHYQDTWAQAMEFFGDRWGRAIRYGGEPVDPESRDGSADGPTRRETIVGSRRLATDSTHLRG
jgi:ppGpp synthetase/RelA/SpoT-type nucleotidyltranferase